MIKASRLGIERIIRKLDHSNVPITTINITPVKAAIGICSIKGDANKIKLNKNKAAAIPDKRPRPPEFTLIIDWPIIAQPPMPPKKPVATLAVPWATHSLLPWPRVSVISSITVMVNNDSIKPIAARITANGKINNKVSIVSGTFGAANVGKPPAILARSPTVLVLRSSPITIKLTTRIPANAEGIAFVTFGKKWVINIVAAIILIMMYNSLPANQLPSVQPHLPPGVDSCNWGICAKKITIAKPFTNPSITGYGTIRMNLPSFKAPAPIWIIPIKTTVANKYWGPIPAPKSRSACATKATITTAKAPVAPEIIPGRPPIMAVIRPTIKAA